MNTWRKSSFSGAVECVEIRWHKSSFSDTTNCVEVGWRKPSSNSSVLIRNSNHPDRCILAFDSVAMHNWIEGIKHGELDS